jgi:hypothetical protein
MPYGALHAPRVLHVEGTSFSKPSCPVLPSGAPRLRYAVADIARPEQISPVVAGAAETHSVYVPSFGDTRAVTREIEPPL